MLKFPQFFGRDEGRLQIKDQYWFFQIELYRMLVLSIDVEILHTDGLDFKGEKIYGVGCRRCTMLIKHKKL